MIIIISAIYFYQINKVSKETISILSKTVNDYKVREESSLTGSSDILRENEDLKEEKNELNSQLSQLNSKITELNSQIDQLKSEISNQSYQANDNTSTSSTSENKTQRQIDEGNTFFINKGVKLGNNGNSITKGDSGGNYPESWVGKKVISYTPPDFDIVDNSVWYFYCPDLNEGVKTKDDKILKIYK